MTFITKSKQNSCVITQCEGLFVPFWNKKYRDETILGQGREITKANSNIW